ncbi:MAG: BamA/TamA family outer membrane protein [Thermodesulfobacteriota bacterium]
MNNLFGHYLRMVFLLLLVLLTVEPALGDAETKVENGGEKRAGFLIVPLPIYTPETKAAFTLTGMVHFRENEVSRPSTFMAFLAYSQLGQFRAAGSAQSYLADGRLHIAGSMGGAKWPDKFFGIGTDNTEDDEEDFTSRDFTGRLALQYRLGKHLKSGLSTEFQHYEITKMEEGGILDTGNVRGAQGGDIFGIGPIVTFDSRDDSFFPRTGVYGQFSAVMFPDSLGEYDFQRYRADLRRYIPAGERGVVAVQAYVNVVRGDIPFTNLSRIGGGGGFSLVRGYYSGLFRERDVAALQAEYRTQVWKKLGAAVFGSAGVIGNDLFRARELAIKPAGGFGLRYRVGGEETINLRFDFAVGNDSSGVYFNILESF